jgi:hypothetical protein
LGSDQDGNQVLQLIALEMFDKVPGASDVTGGVERIGLVALNTGH